MNVAFLKYSLLRITFILVCAGVLYWQGARDWLLWIVAIILGSLLAQLLLGRERDELTSQLDARRRGAQPAPRGNTEDEDYEDSLGN